jgi:hypothetical protein
MLRRWLLLLPVLGVLACFSLQPDSSSSEGCTATPLAFAVPDAASPCTTAGGTCSYSGCSSDEYADNGISCGGEGYPAVTCCIPEHRGEPSDASPTGANDASSDAGAEGTVDAASDGAVDAADAATDGPADASDDASYAAAPSEEAGDGPYDGAG